jgi:hypothetical protein
MHSYRTFLRKLIPMQLSSWEEGLGLGYILSQSSGQSLLSQSGEHTG